MCDLRWYGCFIKRLRLYENPVNYAIFQVNIARTTFAVLLINAYRICTSKFAQFKQLNLLWELHTYCLSNVQCESLIFQFSRITKMFLLFLWLLPLFGTTLSHFCHCLVWKRPCFFFIRQKRILAATFSGKKISLIQHEARQPFQFFSSLSIVFFFFFCFRFFSSLLILFVCFICFLCCRTSIECATLAVLKNILLAC